MSKLEIVAKAIYEHGYSGDWPPTREVDMGMGADYFRGAARAAVEALREPSDAMLRAGQAAGDECTSPLPGEAWKAMIGAVLDGPPRSLWQNMIDAVLSEPQTSSKPLPWSGTEIVRNSTLPGETAFVSSCAALNEPHLCGGFAAEGQGPEITQAQIEAIEMGVK